MSKASHAYAQATFNHALTSGELNDWCEKMQLLQDIKHPALKNPFASDAVIDCLANSLSLSDSQTQWLHSLKKDKCLHLVGKIANHFIKQYQHSQQVTPVILITARRLTEQEQSQFQHKLTDMFKHDINLQFAVNPAIIGGVQLEHSGKLIDLSYAKVINQLHTKK